MGNFISYYMNSSFAQQNLNDYMNIYSNENFKFQKNSEIDEKQFEYDSSLFVPKHYKLFIYIDFESQQLKDLYFNAAHKHNLAVEKYLEALTNFEPNMEKYCFNAGFDLFCPQETESIGAQKLILDYKIKCCMRVVGENDQFVSYYLYSRSSLPLNTPL